MEASQKRPATGWPLSDAKRRFSAVVDAVLAGAPQRVTRRGKPAVAVLAREIVRRRLARHLHSPPRTDASTWRRRRSVW